MGLERVFEASWTLRDLRKAPLGSLLEEFCDWLLGRGFTRGIVRKHLGNLLHLNRWLAQCGWDGANRLSRNEVEGLPGGPPRASSLPWCSGRTPQADESFAQPVR